MLRMTSLLSRKTTKLSCPDTCLFCHYDLPPSASHCPHCARPATYPNVRAAEQPEDSEALHHRYETAVQEADDRGAASTVRNFEIEVSRSKAVLARRFTDLHRLANSDQEVYASYYEQVEAGIKIPNGDKWNNIRGIAEEALFPNYKKHIRMAALSLDNIGVVYYGECSIVLRDDMIAHRTSAFEENNLLWMKRHNIRIWDADDLRKGYRSSWGERSLLAVAKLGKYIRSDTPVTEYPGLLLNQGRGEDADFIELHIWGPMTRRTFAEVRMVPGPHRPDRIKLKAVEQKLRDIGIPLQVT